MASKKNISGLKAGEYQVDGKKVTGLARITPEGLPKGEHFYIKLTVDMTESPVVDILKAAFGDARITWANTTRAKGLAHCEALPNEVILKGLPTTDSTGLKATLAEIVADKTMTDAQKIAAIAKLAMVVPATNTKAKAKTK